MRCYHMDCVPSMCLILFQIPSIAICTRSSAVFADSSAGRISMATPIAGKGLINAPTQNARSDGLSCGGLSPRSSNSRSICPGSLSTCFASCIHRSTRERLLGVRILGLVNSVAFEIARATAMRSFPRISLSSSSWKSKKSTRASVQPNPAVSISPRISKRRPARNSSRMAPSSTTSGLIISTSAPLFKWTDSPVTRRAIPSIPMKGLSF
mmetsp:Transcript_77292/g.214223  ORF Transcript_77292/g.214223 Transcript_77292/m.214223 type:complete len:210 (-) Transcript_77292:12-641(-)